MKTWTRRTVVSTMAGVLFVFHGLITLAQTPDKVDTGTPPFQSFGGGPDVINLGNLNVHYSIPVFSRAGRGMPFSYALAYDSSVWQKLGTAWAPASSSWGVNRDIQALTGVVNIIVRTLRGCDGTGDTTYTLKGYIDSAGTLHKFSNFTVVHTNDNCGPFSASALASDGSGITVTLDADPYAWVTLKSGQVITPPLSSGGSGTTGNTSDSNGNQITSTVSGTTTTFYDTLSMTTPVLTIDASNASSVKYKYASPANPAAQVVASYKSYTVQTHFACSGVNEYGPLSNSLVDRVTLADGSFYQFGYETTPGDNHTPHYVTGRVASVTLPTGGTITYTYSGGDTGTGIMCVDGSTAGFTRQTPDGTWQYRRTGTSPAYTTTITSPPDPVTGQNNVTVVYFQGNYETQREVYQGSASGTPLENIYTCYNGNGISNPSSCVTTAVTTPFSQITKFTSLNGGSQARTDTFYNGYGLVTEVDAYDFDGTLKQKTGTLYGSYVAGGDTCNALANNIVDRPCKITVSDGGGNLKAKTTYGYDETAALGSGITTNHIGVSGSRGNLTTLARYSSSTAAITQTFKNYDTGTVYQSQDVNGQWTTNTYGACAGAFLTNVSMPLNLSKSFAWNCTGGVMTSATDENSKSTSASYTTDQFFWRPENVKDQLLNPTTFSYPSLTRTESSLNFNGATSTLDISTSLDSLGRTVYGQQKQSQSSTTYDTREQTYDSFGRPLQVTLAYAATIASPGPPQGTAATTTYYDALNRPIQSIDGGGGTVNMIYDLNDVYQEVAPKPASDSNTKRKQLEYDSLGRLTSVCEITSAPGSGSCEQQTGGYSGYLTTYVYDSLAVAFSHSLTVTQNAQPGAIGGTQTRSYIYDGLGRLTSETNPESGTTTYTYDKTSAGYCYSGSPAYTSSGNVVARADSNGNHVCYYYDGLNRLTDVGSPIGACKRFRYDNTQGYFGSIPSGVAVMNPLGRLAEAATDTCAQPPSQTSMITDEWFSYSPRGELTDVYEKTPNSGGYYHTAASYWANGGLDTLGLFNSSALALIPTQTYGADGEGRVASVTAASGQSPLSAATYAPSTTTTALTGSLTQVTFGSQDSDSYQYDPNTGRMTQYSFNINGQSAVGNLKWNANGTLQQLGITDPFNSQDNQTCNYFYDDLARLGGRDSNGYTVDCGNVWAQTFTYDAFGNITKSGSISWQPNYANPSNNQYQSGFNGITYDGNGNLLTDTFNTYTWDGYGDLASANGAGIVYDAFGRMVETQSGASQLVYSPTGGQPLAVTSGQTINTAYVPLPGGTFAIYGTSGLVDYNHPDWLGSARLYSTPNRAVIPAMAYAPFGEGYAGGSPLSIQFTGAGHSFTVYHAENQGGSLEDFMFRRYSPVQGRWISPDPAGIGAVDMTNPQSWNRYAYVLNNPLAMVDPLGLEGICYVWNGKDFVPGPCGSKDGNDGPGASPFSREGLDSTLTGSRLCPNDGPCPPIKPANNWKSICSGAAGKTIPVNAPFGQMRFQFNGSGNLIGLGLQLTGMNGVSGNGLSIPANTFAGFTQLSPGTVQFGFSNPVQVGSGVSQAYFQTATFSGGSFTSVQGAYAPLGIPLGSSSGNSSLLQWGLNGQLPFTSSLGSAAQNFGNTLSSLASLVSSNVSCKDVFGGS